MFPCKKALDESAIAKTKSIALAIEGCVVNLAIFYELLNKNMK